MRVLCFILLAAQIGSAQIMTGNKRGIGAGAIPPDVNDSRLMGLSDWSPSASESANIIEGMQFTYSQFTQQNPMPVAAADNCTVLYQNKLYVVGGYGTSSTNYLNNVQILNPLTDTWTQGATKTTAEWGAGCAVYNGKIYTFGGATNATGQGGTTVAEVYDIAGNSWSTLTAIPAAIPDGTMAVTVGNFIYVMWESSFYKFDPSAAGGAGSYTALTSAPGAAQLQWSATGYVNVSGDDRIYFLGGSTGTGIGISYSNVAYYYSVTNGTWSGAQATAPYTAHGMMQNAVYNGDIYFLGGYNNTLVRFFQDLYKYTPATNTWSSVIASMNAWRDGVGGGFYGNKLYAIGGRNASNSQSPFGIAAVESYQIGSSPTALPFTDILLRFKNLPSGNVRMGIYADSSSNPGSLIVDCGTQAAISGFTDCSGLSQTLTPGSKYWLAFILSATNTLFYSGGLPSNPSGTSSSPHCFNSQSFGALPSPFPTSGMTCNTPVGMFAQQLTAPVSYPYKVVQVCPVGSNSGSSSTIACTFGSSVGAHHAIVFLPYWGSTSGTISSTSDTLGSTWTTLASGDSAGSFSTGLVYTCDTGAGGSDTVTVTLTSSQPFRHWVGVEVAGVATSSCVSGTSNLASGTSATATSASVAVSQASLLLGFFGDQAGVTWTPGQDGVNHFYSTFANAQDAGVLVQALQQPITGTYLANTLMSGSSAYHGYMVVIHP